MRLSAIKGQKRHKPQKADTPKRRNLDIDSSASKTAKIQAHFNLKIRRFTFEIRTDIERKLPHKLLTSHTMSKLNPYLSIIENRIRENK